MMKKIDEIRNQLILGDCLDVLKEIPSNTFSGVVTDPPYGLSEHAPEDVRKALRCWLDGKKYEHGKSGFMSKDWDSFVPGPEVWKEVMRVLKPGGHILSFSGTRSYDLMVTAIRIAGAEVRDKLDFYCDVDSYNAWTYSQGFPKSLAIDKAIDKQAGAEREVVGEKIRGDVQAAKEKGSGYLADPANRNNEKQFGYGVEKITIPATDAAKKWEGYGTALKPAHEPIAGFSKSLEDGTMPPPLQADAPFFYEPKVCTRERHYGCKNVFWKFVDEDYKRIPEEEYRELEKENEKRKGEEGFEPHRLTRGNPWATVKPIELCRYLVKMLKMPDNNLILDPFMGSGTTPIACVLEGCDFVGIERDPVAHEIASMRVHYFRCLGKRGLR